MCASAFVYSAIASQSGLCHGAMAFKGPREVVSQSLLDSVKLPSSCASRRRIKKDFSLGMEEFGEPWSDVGETDSEEDFQPTKKKTNVNPKKACAKPTMSHFGAPTTLDQQEKLSKGVVPKNTQKNDAWTQKPLLTGCIQGILLAQKIFVHRILYLLVKQHFWINGSLLSPLK